MRRKGITKSPEKWMKACSKCGNDIYYRSYQSFRQAEAMDSSCEKCRNGGRYESRFCVGDEHGLWKVMDAVVIRAGKVSYIQCVCECGTERLVKAAALVNQTSTSCGCNATLGEQHPKWSGYKGLPGTLLAKLRANARPRGLSVEVTLEQLYELWERQQHLCAISKLPLALPTRTSRSSSASIDRIDSSKGYVLGNVQWVHKAINEMKWDYSQNYFVAMCLKVAESCPKTPEVIHEEQNLV